MIYVTISALAFAALISVAFSSVLRYVVRQSARDRELLVNQLCHLSGRPWQEPPSWAPSAPDEAPVEWSIPEQMEA